MLCKNTLLYIGYIKCDIFEKSANRCNVGHFVMACKIFCIITWLFIFQDEFSNRGAQLGSMEMERLREERKQFQEEIRMERETLDSLKHERRSIEGEITKQKMTREQHTRKLRLVF